MFGSLGLPEMLMIFAVALIVFGPKKLPEIGRTLGKALGEFKKATDELKNTIEREVQIDEQKRILQSITAPPPATQVVSRVEPVTVEPVAIVPPPSEEIAAVHPAPAAIESPVTPPVRSE